MPGNKEANYGALPEGFNPLIPQLQNSDDLPKVEGKYLLEKRVEPQKAEALHLMIVSNVMYGSKFFDAETFEKHIQIAKSLENTKIIFLGPLISNRPTTDKEWIVEQHEYIKDLIDDLDAEKKVLAAVRAPYPKRRMLKPKRNDDDVDDDFEAEMLLPQDPNEYLFKDVSFPVLQNGGILEIPVTDGKSEQLYRLGLFSKAGTSKADLNKNAGVKRAFFQKMAGKADIAIIGNPYIADVTQTIVGNPPTRQELTGITAGGYHGNVTGERPDLTDLANRDGYGVDGEPAGQVITLFAREKDTRVYLKPEQFVYDYVVDDFNKHLDTISEFGKEADFARSLAMRGVKFSLGDKQIIFQDQSYVNKLLEEQHHPQRRRD